MKVTVESLQESFAVIKGQQAADLLITNAKMVDVYSEQVYEGSLLIHKGRIAALNPPTEVAAKAKETLDAGGYYLAPGYVDAHCHIDSHQVTPANFADPIVPYGTTSMICEIEDVVGAAKREGMKAVNVLFSHLDRLPYRVYLQAPGKKVDWDIAREILDMDITIAQGEFAEMDFMEGKRELLEQVAYAREKGKIIHSHVFNKPGEDPYPLNLFAVAGSASDHNAWATEQIEDALRYGMCPMLREGVGGGLDCMGRTVPGLLNHHMPLDSMLFCTDDLTIDIIYRQGHLSHNINLAIGYGMSPLTAIRIATLNAARSFHLEQEIGSLTPGRYADIVFLESLQCADPSLVMMNGKLVAKEKKLLEQPQIDYSSIVSQPGSEQNGLQNLREEELEIRPLEISEDGTKAKITCIYMGMPSDVKEEWLPYVGGKIQPPPELTPISIIQRYPEGARKTTNGFVTGYPLKQGALAGIYNSLSPQICVVGPDVAERFRAAKAMDEHMGGELSMLNGEITSILPLEIYGTITTLTAREVEAATDRMAEAGEALGYPGDGSIMPWYFSIKEMFWMLDRKRLI